MAQNNKHLERYIDDNRLVYMPEIRRLLGISRSTLHRKIKAKIFPPPATYQVNRPCWRFKDIKSWLNTSCTQAG